MRAHADELPAQGFQLDEGIDLKVDVSLGASYEDSTAVYKLYEVDQIPADMTLLEDLEAVLGAYDRYLSEKGTVTAPASQSWIFQANPDMYDLAGAITGLKELSWVTRQHRSRIRAGDRVYVWESGASAGIVATATILTDPGPVPRNEAEDAFWRQKQDATDPNEPSVRIRIDRVLQRRLRKDSLSIHPTLGSLTILRAPVGTNFAVTPEQAQALDKLLAGPAGENPLGFTDAEPVLKAIRGRGFVPSSHGR